LPVGLTFLQTELRLSTWLESVVTVVDSVGFLPDLGRHDAAMRQIIHADLVVLNKIDLVDEATIWMLERRIAILKPRVKVVRASRGRIPLAAILDPMTASALHDLEATEGRLPIRHLDDGFTAYAFQWEGALSARALQRWLDRGLPDGVIRAKGIVSLDTPQSRYVFQYCGGRASFDPYPGAQSGTRLVFIGTAIDELALSIQLERCRADANLCGQGGRTDEPTAACWRQYGSHRGGES